MASFQKYAFIKPWTSDFFKDFFVDKKDIGDSKDGDVVEFKILEWGKKQYLKLWAIPTKILILWPRQNNFLKR